jgi:hypothetical protein
MPYPAVGIIFVPSAAYFVFHVDGNICRKLNAWVQSMFKVTFRVNWGGGIAGKDPSQMFSLLFSPLFSLLYLLPQPQCRGNPALFL